MTETGVRTWKEKYIADFIDAVEVTVKDLITVSGQRRPVVTVDTTENDFIVYGDGIVIAVVLIDDVKANINSMKGFVGLVRRALDEEKHTN